MTMLRYSDAQSLAETLGSSLTENHQPRDSNVTLSEAKISIGFTKVTDHAQFSANSRRASAINGHLLKLLG